ncbi:MAG: hypothetical protein IJU95_01460 [Treponema sp.]|nr:hypothetical protein [Treponema sp.]
MSKDEEKSKDIKDRWLGILALVAAVFAAWFVANIQPKGANLAKSFDGNIERSAFYEENSGEPFFTQEEIAELTEAVRDLAERLHINIIVFAGRNPMSDYETEDFANRGYDELFGEYTDGVFYYMDMTGDSPAYDYLSTSGRAALYYEKAREQIFTGMDSYLPSSYSVRENGYEPYREDIKRGINFFLDQLRYYGETYSSKTFYMKSHNSDKYMYFCNGEFYVSASRPPAQKFYLILAGLGVGLIIALSISSSVKKHYRFIAPVSSSVYIPKNGIKIEKQDILTGENTSKRYIPPASSSGGRSGGGHSGGYSGGSHGGGGHHR